MAAPGLILLAGTSEAGKSTAGAYLARLGAHRLKIRPILLGLVSGVEVDHEGVTTREGFDPNEFRLALSDRVRAGAQAVTVIESFIDVRLARYTVKTWPGVAVTVFLTAKEPLRARRLAAAASVSEAVALEIVRAKDGRKRVVEQMPEWRRVADYWVNNDGTMPDLLAQLDQIYRTVLRHVQGEDS